MRTFVRHLVVIVMMAFASMAAVTIATPGGELGRLRGRRVVGPDGEGLPAARGRATTFGMRPGPVVGPDG